MTLRRLSMMSEGKADAIIDQFWLEQDDAWQRTAEIVAMVHNTTRSNANQCKLPADFNHLARWLEGKAGEKKRQEQDDRETESAFAWARKHAKNKAMQNASSKAGA